MQDIIAGTMSIDPATIEVRVQDGVVRLRGRVSLRSTKEIVVDLVHRVDGVVGVEDELTYQPDDPGAHPPPASPGGVTGSPERPDYASRS